MPIQVLITDDHKVVRQGLRGFLELDPALEVVGEACGLVAGVFFAFSTFVMPALKRLPPAHGIAAMQSINTVAVTPAFMTVLFGTAVACLGMITWAAISSSERPAALVLAGAARYIVGTLGVTIACNVPLNDRLATLHPQGADAAGRWEEYVAKWTAWNHLRAAASLAAAAALTIALQVYGVWAESWR